MILAGGDPTTLSLRGFLDCTYAIFVREYQRLGMDLITAIERVNASIGLEPASADGQPAVVSVTERATDVPSAAENDRALAELQKMMGGIG